MLDQGTLVPAEGSFYFIVRKEMIDLIRLLRTAKDVQQNFAIGTRSLQMHTGIGRVLGMSHSPQSTVGL